MLRILAVCGLAAFALSAPIAPVSTPVEAQSCTNSYDRASDGSRCGRRASGCRAGGRGGYC